MSKPRLLVVVAVASVAVAVIALLLRPSGEAAPRVSVERVTLIADGQRKALPEAAAPTLTPPPPAIALASLRGRPAFVDVWASWCIPCREEAPLLARLWRQYRHEVRFVGVDVEDTRADARAFVRRFGLGYPHLFDPKAALASKLGFFGLPTAYLVGADGRVAAKLVGKQKAAVLRSALAALAAEGKGG